MDVIDVVAREVPPVDGSSAAALVVTPHPLTLAGQRVLDAQQAALVPGETLAVLLARHGVQPGQQWVVLIGGVPVPEWHWRLVRPRHGHLIEAQRVPQREVLRLVAFVALFWFTGGLANNGVLGFAGKSFGAAMVAGVVMMAGSMVINKLLGPKPLTAVTNTVSPTYALSAGRNRARPFEPMALVLGEPYAVPDLAAQPYTYFANGEQCLWQLFHCGINCAEFTALQIGQTSIETYKYVALTYTGFDSSNTRFASGAIGLPLLGTSVDSIDGALLDAVTAPGTWVVRTSSLGTLQLALDLEASLYRVEDNGGFASLTCDITIEYRLVGATDWLPFDDAGALQTLTNASSKPLRVTMTRLLTPGQYEVRARKETVNATTSKSQNVVAWVALKSYQADTGSYDGQARLGVQIQASGQLNGALDEVNCTLMALPHPYWNGSAWVTATSRDTGLSNPGAILLMLARGIYNSAGRLLAGLGFADAQIDIEGLKLFMVRCAAKGFTFDWFVQETTSIGDLMDAVAAVGMGSIAWPDGKLGVTWFSEAQPVEGVLNMATMKAKTFSVAYDTQPTAEEIEVQYFDRDRGNIWQSLRVLAPGVTMPTSTARMQLAGVTTEAHAALLARFSMAQNIYQRKTVSVEVDLEHMTFRRGTVLALSHDVTQWGYGGRVQAASNVGGTVTLTLDDVVPAVSPTGVTSRYIGLRLAGEAQYRIFPVTAFTGTSRTVTLASAWPSGVAVPGDSAGNPAHDAVWIYDFKATPGQRLRVAGVTPTGNLDGARVALVPETDEFWTYVNTGSYVPPPYTSLLQPPPSIASAQVTEQMFRQGASYYTELTISYVGGGSLARTELWGAVGDGPLQWLGASRALAITWRGGLSETWRLELRPYGDAASGSVYAMLYTVTGLAEPPPPFDTFMVLAQPDGTRQYNFGYVATPVPADWQGAEIRYTTGVVGSPVWESMSPLQDAATFYTASPVELNAPLAGTYTFACRSRDTSGNVSTLRVQSLSLNERRSGNVLAEFVEDREGWMGALSGFTRIAGALEATDSTTVATLPATWSAWSRWNTSPASPAVYTSPARDLGVSMVAAINSTVDVDGSYTMELRTSADGTSWSAWGPIAPAFSARWIQVRITVTATGGAPVPVVRAWVYRVTVDFKTEYLNDQIIAGFTGSYRIGTGDVRAPLQNSYSVIRRAEVTVQDTRAGTWSWQRMDNNVSPGPRWQFKLDGTLTDPALVDFYIEGI